MASRVRHVVLGGMLLVLLALALPVSAHGNSITADAQISANGTVRVELVANIAEAFLVLHEGANGTPGDVIGHRTLSQPAVRYDVPVGVRESYWRNRSGNLTVHAVLHFDDNRNGQFDPGVDPPIERAESNGSVATSFTVRKGEGAVNVLAAREHPQTTNETRVQVRRVQLAEPGYLAIRADAGGSPGEVVGVRRLDAGLHRNVTVSIDEGFYLGRPEQFSLWAVVHGSDGDDAFEPERDPPVTAGGNPVATRFDVERTGNLSEHQHAETATPTATPAATPEPTATPTATATPAPTVTSTPSDTPTGTFAVSTPSDTPTETASRGVDRVSTASPAGTPTTVNIPGFGFLIGVLGVVAFALVLRRRK